MVQQSASRMAFALLLGYVLLRSFVSFVLRRDWIGHANWQFAPVSASPLTQLTHASLRRRSNISKLRCHFKLDRLPPDWVLEKSCSYADKVQCIRNSFGHIWSLYWDWGQVEWWTLDSVLMWSIHITTFAKHATLDYHVKHISNKITIFYSSPQKRTNTYCRIWTGRRQAR